MLVLLGGAGCQLAIPVEGKCRPTGCSGEICADRPAASTCEYRKEYECYANATCERQSDGACGWTPTDELSKCLAGSNADGGQPATCVRGGCSGQLCVDASQAGLPTTCEWREEYACYANATCERQSDGTCGWTPTNELFKCLAGSGADGGQPITCVRGGCSGQLCVDASQGDVATTCEWRDEYACYQNASCELQADGKCGWTMDGALRSCLATHK